MSTNLKLMLAAIAIAVTAVSVMSTSVSAQIYGPYRDRGFISNGTGTVPDRLRDPHDDRGGNYGGGG
jgi:hypothetical protein